MPELLEQEKVLCDLSKIEKDEVLAVTYYVKVDSISGNQLNLVDLERGEDFTMHGKELIETMCSAKQYTNTEKVSKSKIVEILANVRNNVFTVNFNKQASAKTVNEALAGINKGKILNNSEITAVVKEAYKGEERTLTGRMVQVETGLGRSQVIDLSIEKKEGSYDNRLRQVDHRTINWLVSAGTRYEVKKS